MPLKDLFSRKKDKPAAAAGAPPAASRSAGADPIMALFETYKESDEDRIGPEGIMQLCSDMNVDPSDVKVLIMAWQFNAEQQGYFTKSEWKKGLTMLRADSPPVMLARLDVLDKQLRDSTKSAAFKDFFRFSFRFSRSPGQKALEIDTVKALLPIVLPPTHPHVTKLIAFLEASPSVRGFTEDQWNSFLIFTHEIAEDFSNFDPEGAWPSVLDDFVTFCKQ